MHAVSTLISINLLEIAAVANGSRSRGVAHVVVRAILAEASSSRCLHLLAVVHVLLLAYGTLLAWHTNIRLWCHEIRTGELPAVMAAAGTVLLMTDRPLVWLVEPCC